MRDQKLLVKGESRVLLATGGVKLREVWPEVADVMQREAFLASAGA